ncbi:MAG TPA: hypothetical protein VEI49_10250, partial [Terriglobales bacterium]|nr:hypothetical protein [Terriglobales bacterium]
TALRPTHERSRLHCASPFVFLWREEGGRGQLRVVRFDVQSHGARAVFRVGTFSTTVYWGEPLC